MTVPRHRPPAIDAIGPPRPASHRASFDARLLCPRLCLSPSPSPSPSPATPATCRSAASRASSRRSFLGGFSDFATLLRSHRSCGRRKAGEGQPDITSKEFFSEYAGQPDLDQDTRVADTMHSDRPSREQKPSNKLYQFLTRSRSRSRSKQEETPTTMPSPASKPASRIPSRPLSSTTTATNTTITPATPKPRRHQPPAPPDPPSSSRPTTPKPSAARQRLHDLFGIPLRKGSSRSRSRSRPSSPVPPPIRASLDVPPLPTAPMHDDDPTPRPRKSYAPQISRPRSPSPTPGPKVLRVTNATTTSSSTGSTAASIKISKFFTKASTPPPDTKRTPRPSAAPTPGGPPILPPIPSIVSRVSSLHRRSTKDPDRPLQTVHAPTPPPKIVHTPPTPLRNGTSTGTVSASTSGSSSRLPVSSSNTSGSSAPSAGPVRLGHAAKGSLDSSYRYRGTAPPMRAVAEEGPGPSANSSAHGHAASSTSHSKGKARETPTPAPSGPGIPVPRPSGTKMSSAVRATKHGSFDFERPGGWSGVVGMQRSGSGGTTGTSASGTSRRSGADGVRERESTYGPGLAGVGTLQREVSMKRAQDREELLRTKERGRRPDKDKDKDRTRGSASQRTTPETAHASTSTGASASAAANGKSSSMGRAAGRRTAQLLPKRLVGLTAAQHGPFPFEPAVPSPTWSTGTASTGTAHEVALPAAWPSRVEKERARLRDEKERARSGLFGKRRSGDRAPVPVPIPSVPPPYADRSGVPEPDSPGPIPIPMPLTLSAMLDAGTTGRAGRAPRASAGHRSGTKGRSLDLGLGLAWAPSKVREEALLPKSAFFSRTPSASSAGSRAEHAMVRTASATSARSGLGRSASVSAAHGQGQGERAKLGREVAETFRSTLDGEGYKLFKSYVHQFDAHEIPFDGPLGIVARVEELLVSAPNHLGEDARKRLLDKFVRIILQVA